MSKNKFGNPPMSPQLNVDLSKADDVTCERCGNYTFEQVMLMKKMSALISPTGKEAIVPIPTFACNACGHINKGFLPVLPKETEEKPVEQKSSLVLEK
jgi:uncharacterized Zn finger protein